MSYCCICRRFNYQLSVEERSYESQSRYFKSFECVDKGPISYFLGMEITREGETGAIAIAQTQYIKELLKQHNMVECRPATTPLDTGFQIGCNSDSCAKIDANKYQSAIGALMYLRYQRGLTFRTQFLNWHSETITRTKSTIQALNMSCDT